MTQTSTAAPITAQEVFDKVVNHLRAQRCKSIGFTNNDKQCLYRGPNETKCAAGVLIPDEVYRPWMEGTRIKVLLTGHIGQIMNNTVSEDEFTRAQNDLSVYKDYNNLIVSLQDTHDNCEIFFWERSFQTIASVYGLTYTPPVT